MRKASTVLLLLLAVRASAVSLPIGVSPNSGWTFGPVRVTVYAPAAFTCAPGAACHVQVFFGNVEAQVLQVSPNELVAIVPPDDEPLVDVRVVIDGVTRLELPRSFGWSATMQLDPPNYTPLLVPVLAGFELPGADGTLWQSELKIFNGGPVALRPVTGGGTRLQHVIPHDASIAAGQTARVLTFKRVSGPGNGAILHIPTPLVPTTHFAMRVRNLSADDEGTELPVVPREEFRPRVTLINIPTAARFGATLRVYHWSETRGLRSRVSIYAEGETNPLRVIELASTGQSEVDEFFADPSYAQLDLLTPDIRANADRIRVEIDNLDASAPPIWAFVSVTHNVTHHVTAIVPKTNH